MGRIEIKEKIIGSVRYPKDTVMFLNNCHIQGNLIAAKVIALKSLTVKRSMDIDGDVTVSGDLQVIKGPLLTKGNIRCNGDIKTGGKLETDNGDILARNIEA